MGNDNQNEYFGNKHAHIPGDVFTLSCNWIGLFQVIMPLVKIMNLFANKIISKHFKIKS